jgi:hypothetical protein
MNLSTVLAAAIRSKFSAVPFSYSVEAPCIATLDFPHGCIGPIWIVDDSDEITIYIDKATHCHFSCYEESFSETEKEDYICNKVIDWLDALFQDRLVILTIFGGFSGGWEVYPESSRVPKHSLIWSRYLWSRKL